MKYLILFLLLHLQAQSQEIKLTELASALFQTNGDVSKVLLIFGENNPPRKTKVIQDRPQNAGIKYAFLRKDGMVLEGQKGDCFSWVGLSPPPLTQLSSTKNLSELLDLVTGKSNQGVPPDYIAGPNGLENLMDPAARTIMGDIAFLRVAYVFEGRFVLIDCVLEYPNGSFKNKDMDVFMALFQRSSFTIRVSEKLID